MKIVRNVQIIMVYTARMICPHLINGKCRGHTLFEIFSRHPVSKFPVYVYQNFKLDPSHTILHYIKAYVFNSFMIQWLVCRNISLYPREKARAKYLWQYARIIQMEVAIRIFHLYNVASRFCFKYRHIIIITSNMILPVQCRNEFGHIYQINGKYRSWLAQTHPVEKRTVNGYETFYISFKENKPVVFFIWQMLPVFSNWKVCEYFHYYFYLSHRQ